MGHALTKGETQERDQPDMASGRADVAQYAADMLASLRRLSEANGMPLLAHLTDLARLEAVRNTET
ncbi:MAG TPA: hypothetical protein VN723_07985 [Rhizomicrobium sp.]|jgi:hypothetical protein|nr:hypothetical protein [Rhizomicrobium sp.]